MVRRTYAYVRGTTGDHTIVYPDIGCSCAGYSAHGHCKHFSAVVSGDFECLKVISVSEIDAWMEKEVRRLPSSLAAITSVVGGEPYVGDMITSIYGLPMAGKTLLMLQEAAFLEAQGVKVLFIDTEGSLYSMARSWLPKLRKRFGSQGGGIYVVSKHTFEELMHMLGMRVRFVTKGEGDTTKVEFNIVEVLPDSQVGQFVRERGVGAVILDSVTAPLRVIPSGQQNFPARADATSALMSRLLLIQDRHGVPIITTHHASLNPANPYQTLADMRGGVAVYHYSKLIIYVDYREAKEVRRFRRFWLVRAPNAEEFSRVGIAEITDEGYVDSQVDPSSVLTQSELKRVAGEQEQQQSAIKRRK